MSKTEEAYLRQSESVLHDVELHDEKISQRSTFQHSLQNNLTVFADVERMQQRAASVRWKTIEHLDKYLIEFEANFIKPGGKVLWAQHAADAQKEILSVIKKHQSKNVKCFTNGLFEELQLEDAFLKEDIFCAKPEEQIENSICVLQASFVIADPGGVVIVSQDESMQQQIAGAKAIIVMAHIDELLPNMADINLFLPLVASYKTSNSNFPFIKILHAPKSESDLEGPDELYVLLIDNGRSELMADTLTRELNRCIHCNACKHVCPVYAATGKPDNDINHIYTGPVSAISKTFSENFEEFNFLSRTTTLCGACTDVCPVKINLHKMFVHARKKTVNENLNQQSEKLFYFLWKQSMLKRDRWSFAKNVSKKLLQQNLYEKVWGNKNDMPEIAAKSFNDLWREKYGN